MKTIGGRVTGVQGDMANLADIDRLYDAVQKKHQQIDAIFANAGGGEFAPLGAITEEHYQRIVRYQREAVSSSPCRKRRRCFATELQSS